MSAHDNMQKLYDDTRPDTSSQNNGEGQPILVAEVGDALHHKKKGVA